MDVKLKTLLESLNAESTDESSSVVTFHFFRRTDGYYSCYGNRAKELARAFFGTERVVRTDAEGVKFLNVTRTHLSKIASQLLLGNKCVSIWCDTTSGWHEVKASPGDASGIEDELEFSIQDSLSSVGSIAAMIYEEADACIRVGMAFISTSAGTIELLEFIDTDDFGNLETALMQHGVRECLVGMGWGACGKNNHHVDTENSAAEKGLVSTGAYQQMPRSTATKSSSLLHSALPEVFNKVGVLVRAQHPSIFKIRDTADVLSQLECLCTGRKEPQEKTGDAGSAIGYEHVHEVKKTIEGMASAMEIALCATSALLRYLELYDNESEYGGYRLKQGCLQDVLQYDASVSRALSIFPDAQYSSSAVHLSQYPAATAGAPTASAAPADTVADGAEGGAESSHSVLAAGDGDDKTIGLSEGGCKPDTLFGLLNTTKTLMGTKLLIQWMQQPVRDRDVIKRRQDVIEALISHPRECALLRDDADYLPRSPDLLRLVRKLRTKQKPNTTSSSTSASNSSSLFDLVAVYRCLLKLQAISDVLDTLNIPSSSKLTATATANAATATAASSSSSKEATQWQKEANIAEKMKWRCEQCSKFVEMVEDLLDKERLEGGRKRDCLWRLHWIQIRHDFNEDMTSIYSELSESRASIEEEFKQLVSISKLKEKDVHLTRRDPYGICVRITKKNWPVASKLFRAAKQDTRVFTTLKSGVFFTTDKFSALTTAYDKIATEYEAAQSAVIADALKIAETYEHVFRGVAALIAEVDCLASLAHVAATSGWTKPDIVPADSPRELAIKNLRHPVVEARVGTSYVASDVHMGEDERIVIITGPNCGGKSTYIRAVGLCVILAHMGSFVPASSARIPLMDCIMTRVGAADSTARGISTFMREMLDVCSMLRKATQSSLVIIDELGRGTSTEDGFGIAWAVLERLAKDARCFVLFATHFHELTSIADEIPGVRNCHVSARVRSPRSTFATSHAGHPGSGSGSGPDSRGGLTFLYKVEPGVCSKSYGIEVARLADFPKEIVDEAEAISAALEGESSPIQELLSPSSSAATAPLSKRHRTA